jgi:hypothetical protein
MSGLFDKESSLARFGVNVYNLGEWPKLPEPFSIFYGSKRQQESNWLFNIVLQN